MLQHPSVVQRTGEASKRSSGGVTAVDAIHLDCVINLTAVQVELETKIWQSEAVRCVLAFCSDFN